MRLVLVQNLLFRRSIAGHLHDLLKHVSEKVSKAASLGMQRVNVDPYE